VFWRLREKKKKRVHEKIIYCKIDGNKYILW